MASNIWQWKADWQADIDRGFVNVPEAYPKADLATWRGLGYADLSKLNPKLVMVRISGFGQTGPYNQRAGYGVIGEAVSGLRHLTGDPDRTMDEIADFVCQDPALLARILPLIPDCFTSSDPTAPTLRDHIKSFGRERIRVRPGGESLRLGPEVRVQVGGREAGDRVVGRARHDRDAVETDLELDTFLAEEADVLHPGPGLDALELGPLVVEAREEVHGQDEEDEAGRTGERESGHAAICADKARDHPVGHRLHLPAAAAACGRRAHYGRHGRGFHHHRHHLN